MSTVAAGATVAGAFRVGAVLLVAYLVAGQPVVGGWSQRRFTRSLLFDPAARLARYRRTMLIEWPLAAVALLLVALAPGLDLADSGVRWPRLTGYTVVGGLGLVASAGLLAGLRRRVDRGVDVVAPAEVAVLLPRTAAERRVFLGLAVSAGVCEETLYRGFLLAVVTALAPDLAAGWLAVVSALAFGLAHVYQGALGVATSVVLGGCLAVLYLGSGSLLLPVLYHVLIDLRVLVLAVGRRRQPRHRAV